EVDHAVQAGDAPATVLADIAVLVGRLAPTALVAEPADHHQRAPAAPGGARLAVDVQHRLQLHVVVERAMAVGRQVAQVFAYPLAADEDAPPGDLERAFAREQVRCLVPQALVDVVAVGALQVDEIAVVLR